MTEQEVYTKIKPLLDGLTEGLYWDFKKTLTDTADIIKDIPIVTTLGIATLLSVSANLPHKRLSQKLRFHQKTVVA